MLLQIRRLQGQKACVRKARYVWRLFIRFNTRLVKIIMFPTHRALPTLSHLHANVARFYGSFSRVVLR